MGCVDGPLTFFRHSAPLKLRSRLAIESCSALWLVVSLPIQVGNAIAREALLEVDPIILGSASSNGFIVSTRRLQSLLITIQKLEFTGKNAFRPGKNAFRPSSVCSQSPNARMYFARLFSLYKDAIAAQKFFGAFIDKDLLTKLSEMAPCHGLGQCFGESLRPQQRKRGSA